jgi:indolepyruvate ferredoxin oxidoreductase, alpha subunit
MESPAVAQRPLKMWSSSRVVAHALVRAGYGFVTSYPGSPTTEITDELERLAKRSIVSFRYATNEKVAFEMAAAVAVSGGRAAVVMKHVGLNVALDAVFGVAYSGITGGLVVVVGDDPGCESSSTEQDTRLMARMLSVPCLEPSSIRDVASTVALAAELSERIGSLVILRMTTALCHGAAPIAFEAVTKPAESRPLAPPKDPSRFVILPSVARRLRVGHLERVEAARAWAEDRRLWLEGPGDAGPLGFFVQNAVYESFRRACARLGIDPPVLRTHVTFPLATTRLREFATRHARIIVVEELETVLEDQAVALVHREGLAVRIEGQRLFPRHGRLDEERLVTHLASLLGLPEPTDRPIGATLPLFQRPPTFCAGCPHTASFYSLKRVLESLPSRPYVSSDIGCYTLGSKPGIEVGDSTFCMGASIGVATGMALSGQRALALIGDSTFLHAGLPALENAVRAGADLLVCVLDNAQAAMTGGPRTPGSDELARVCLGLGVARVEVVDPFDVPKTDALLRELLEAKGVSVLIAKSPCALITPAQPRRPRVDETRCNGCGDCVTKIHCPAISLSEAKKFVVAADRCVGCGFCSSICPEGALTPEAIA